MYSRVSLTYFVKKCYINNNNFVCLLIDIVLGTRRILNI